MGIHLVLKYLIFSTSPSLPFTGTIGFHSCEMLAPHNYNDVYVGLTRLGGPKT